MSSSYRLNSRRPPLAIVYLLVGVVLILYPEMSSKLFCWGVGILSLLYAAAGFWRFSRARREGILLRGECTVALLLTVLGAVCLLFPQTILSFLPFTLGCLLLLVGLMKAPSAWQAVRERLPMAWFTVLLAVVPLVLGGVLFFNPFAAVKTVVLFFGVSLTAAGVCDLIDLYFTHRN